MANWLQFEKKPAEKKPDDRVPEITPESINKTLTEQKTEFETKLTALGSKIDDHPTLKAMQEYLDAQKASATAAAQRKANETRQQQDQRFENVDQTTREYVDQTLRPIAQATLLQQGNQQRASIFEDQENFPYYTGTIKAQIDALLDAQPLDQRANPDIIRNVYKIVVFDHDKEIKENKHKSRFSSASSSGTGTGAPTGDGKTTPPALTEQMKKVARDMGMTETEYATARQELQLTGELD